MTKRPQSGRYMIFKFPVCTDIISLIMLYEAIKITPLKSHDYVRVMTEVVSTVSSLCTSPVLIM